MRTSHTSGCSCDHCVDNLIKEMCPDSMDFIGKRADSILIEDVLDGEDYDDDVVIEKQGTLRAITVSTSTCPDCGGDGYYDDIGEIVCEDCGVVISGDDLPVLSIEYDADEADDSVGSSRGLEKMPGTRGSRGTHDPSI